MEYNIEYCDPFRDDNSSFWMKLEHCGRYLWATEYLSECGCRSVADLACASGYGSIILSNSIPEVYAADRNEQYLQLFEKSNITKLCIDFDDEKISEKINVVDSVVCFETIEHVKKPEHLLDEIHSLLADSGVLLLSVPSKKYERFDENGKNLDVFHLSVFDDDEMVEMLRKTGFEVENVLGQDICNRIVSRLSNMHKAGLIDKNAFTQQFHDDSDAIVNYSYIFAYPEPLIEDNSYSKIYCCKKV